MKEYDLVLTTAKPSDRPHFLAWDNPHDLAVNQLCFYNQAEKIDYRLNLLNRINPNTQFLILHQHLDREIKAIRDICANANSRVVLLTGLDCLITYLTIHPRGQVSIFWQRLINLRQLKAILWLLLPTPIIPHYLPRVVSRLG